MLRPCVIFDIDGTIADCSHRLRFIKGDGKPDWQSFFDPQLVAKDGVIQPMLEMLALMQQTFPIVFASGRPKRIKGATIGWLHVNAPWLTSYSTYMRADEDRRSSAEVKRDYLDKMARDGFRPIYAFEDRAADAAMWRAAGITCFQVAEGAY